MNKRGLSDVVTTLIIILLSIVAIGVVWVVINGLLESSQSDIDRTTASIGDDYSVLSKSVKLEQGDKVSFSVKREGGEVKTTGLKIVIEASDGSTYSQDVDVELNALESKEVSIDLGGIDGKEISKICIVPKYQSNGEEFLGSVPYCTKINSVGPADMYN